MCKYFGWLKSDQNTTRYNFLGPIVFRFSRPCQYILCHLPLFSSSITFINFLTSHSVDKSFQYATISMSSKSKFSTAWKSQAIRLNSYKKNLVIAIRMHLVTILETLLKFCKVQIFWESHKNLKKYPSLFDVTK